MIYLGNFQSAAEVAGGGDQCMKSDAENRICKPVPLLPRMSCL